MLLIDSIQAGIRGQGCLSVIDYEGFQDAEAPDMETWSKAINAGQYPLSVLGMNQRLRVIRCRNLWQYYDYKSPCFGNSSCSTQQVDDNLRTNIRDRGIEFVSKLESLPMSFPAP